MSHLSTTQGVLFQDTFLQPLVARFDQPDSSSDGGAVLLKACDQRLGLIEALAACLHDPRDSARIRHSLKELVAQRVYGMACGYEDCNDSARLATDPMQRLLLDRDPLQGAALASQPTLSRFENGVDARTLIHMGHALAERVIARHRKRLGKRVRRITIDMDPTDDPTYGGQQLALFNGHYANWCYLPMACFLQFDAEPDQYLFAWVLRGGKAHATHGAIGLLRRVIQQLWQVFPGAKIRVRLDGGFAAPKLFEFLDASGVEYVVAMAKNPVLMRQATDAMATVREQVQASGQTEHVYGECRYAATSWFRQRRIVYKAEVVCLAGSPPRDNARFVVTNIRRVPRSVYEKVYCKRGAVEDRIKELLYGLHLDRTSCTRFLANQLRCLLGAAAYMLLQELRLKAERTSLANAQVTTLRERLLKLAVWVARSTRRIVLHLPVSAPWRQDWCRVARAVGAAPA
ncbi:MAG TPA: IS1380 family transposase [Rhodanobacteraceae bacterium]